MGKTDAGEKHGWQGETGASSAVPVEKRLELVLLVNGLFGSP